MLAICARGVFAANFAVSVAYVALNFSTEEQGLFFSFIGFASLVQISDFGLSYAALQMSSHLKAIGQAGRIGSLLRWCRVRNALTIAAAVPFIGVLGAASLLAGTHAVADPLGWPHWAGPWVASLAALLLYQGVLPEFAVSEGAGYTEVVWKNRIYQEVLGGAVMIGALISGAGLWSLPAYWFTRTFCALSLASVLRGGYPDQPGFKACGQSWHDEVWPFQWRMGVSAVTGFLVFQAMTPVVLVGIGPDAAGRFGLSLAIMNGLLMLSTVWPLSQIPRFVELASTGQRRLARRQFLHLTLQSGAVAALLAVATGIAVIFAIDNTPGIAPKIGDRWTLVCLLCAFLVHHVNHCLSIVIRADRQEPMLFVNLLGAAAGLAVMCLVAANNDLAEVSMTYLLFTVGGMILCIKYYRLSSTGRPESRPTGK